MSSTCDFDAVVIGGGPAGSTASAILAAKGRRVVLFEKEKFPRYHIGESMMPLCYFPLARLGLIDKMKTSHFVRKHSVQFVRMDGRASTPFYFAHHLKHEAAATWQVIRSEFDQMLLDNARAKGVQVHEETRVVSLIKEDNAICGVTVQTRDGQMKTYRAPMTIDASGRDQHSIARCGWRVDDPTLKKIAIWTYYKGALRDPGIDEGATTVAYIPEKGWFWYIPLPDDVLSVGVVAEKDYLYRDPQVKDLQEIFLREVQTNKWIERHLAPGAICEKFRTTGEYSYRSRYCAANGLLLAGDAFGFLDPVFSSGLLLALRSGELAGDAVDQALSSGDYTADQFAGYGAEVCRGIECMRKLVYAFYDQTFHFRALFDRHPHLRGDVTDTLIGSLFSDHSELYAAVAEFAALPADLPHGQPLAGELSAALVR